jgi:hypothetical protein
MLSISIDIGTLFVIAISVTVLLGLFLLFACHPDAAASACREAAAPLFFGELGAYPAVQPGQRRPWGSSPLLP